MKRRKRYSILLGGLVLLLAGSVAACGPPPSSGPPVIVAFSATGSQISAGESTTLLWNVTGATSVTIDHGVGNVPVAGTKEVSPAATTGYTLTAANTVGTVTRSVVITVTAPPTDSEPPIITNVSVSSITKTSAVITWTTDEPATSQAEYGTTSSYGSTSALDDELTTSHSVTVSGLDGETTYHYRVKSKDVAGNEAVATDRTFTTSAVADTTPPVISEVTVSNVTDASATVTWTTDEPATSQVEYGTTNSCGSTTTLDEELTTSHSVMLTGLDLDTTYHFRVKSEDASENEAVSTDETFTTLAEADTTPPAISGVAVSNVTKSGATISWETDEPANSLVEYGTTATYGSSTSLDEALVTSHSVALTGLESDTTYHFRVKSEDASGNEATSDADQTLTTEADTTPPNVATNDATDVRSTEARLNGDLSDLGTASIAYVSFEWGTTTAYGNSTTAEARDSIGPFAVNISGLDPYAAYHFRAKAVADETAYGADKSFTTMATWTPMTSGITNTLRGVWGSSASDVFAVGHGGTIVHYDGTSWSSMASGTANTLRGVWGSSASDIFAVGESGTILHYDGTSWSSMASGTENNLRAVWGSSASDVFAVGHGGTILHYDGGDWNSMNSGGSALRGVWGSSGNDVFCVGANPPPILHYNGTAWSTMNDPTGTSSLALDGVWGSSGTDVFAVGYLGLFSGTILHYDGADWSTMNSGTRTLNSVWGSSGTDVFAVGAGGTILHYDGEEWGAMSSGHTGGLSGVWGSSGSDVFAVGGWAILHYDGRSWRSP